MLTSRVLVLGVFGWLLVSCGDSKKDVPSRTNAAGASGTGGASGGKGGAAGSAGTSAGGASGSSTGATGGSTGGGATGGNAGAGDTGGEGGTDSLGDGLEGIYTLDDAIQNSDSCDPGGTSVRGAYEATHLVIRRSTVGSNPAVVVAGCSGLDACRTLGAALVDDATAFELSPYYLFTSDEPGGTFSGTVVYYGSLDGTTCLDGGIDSTSLSVAGVALSLEIRTQRTDYPAMNGTCPQGLAAEQGAMAQCTRLRVIGGTRVETF